jgi:cardiolipin synthase
LLQLATERLRITTAYFVPDPELTGRLCDAADRGVEVQILLPGPHADKRFVQLAAESMYGELLDHGVGIWAFQPSMLHAKIMTLDGLVSNIGSANLNTRSVAWDEEVNLVAVDHELTALLDDQFDQDLERSVRFERGRWEQRALRQRLAERAVTPLKRWF